MAGRDSGEGRLLEGSRGGGELGEGPQHDSGMVGGRLEKDDSARLRVGADVVFGLASGVRLIVELPLDGVPVSHPYISERLPLALSSRNFPLTRSPGRVELEVLAVEVVVLLEVDRDVCRGRLVEDIDRRCAVSFSFGLSFIVCGTPSHLELTLGTVGGSLADETPGKPTAFALPLCVVPRFFICS